MNRIGAAMMRPRYLSYLIEFSGDEALGVLEVLGGVELDGEETGGVDDTEGMSLGDETLEGALVENIDEPLVFDHLPEFAEEGGAVVGANLLNADAFAGGFSR